MALSANTVWEIRPSATTGDVNGGGFVTGAAGVDYSKQDLAQYSGANLACAAGTTNPSVITSATHNFVTADEGNLIHITAGTNWTAGWYQIVSTAGNAATLDRAVGTAVSLSSGTFNVGGALSFNSTLMATAMNTAVGGNKFWMMAGTYTQANVVQTTSTGSGTAPILFEGYAVTRGDTPIGTARPLINFTGGSGSNQLQTPANGFWSFYNLSMESTLGTVTLLNNGPGVIQNCRVINSSTTAGRSAITCSATDIINCEAVSYRGNAIQAGNVNYSVIGCYIHDSDKGINSTGTGNVPYIVNNIIANCVTSAITCTGAHTNHMLILNNTIYGAENKLGVGIALSTGAYATTVMGNIIYGCTTGISHADAVNLNYSMYNTINNCTTPRTNFPAGVGDITTAPGFVSVAQITGTTATTAANILTDAAADFSNVVDGLTFCYLVSGTGITAGVYLITSHTLHGITLSPTPGNDATANKVYQVTTGLNWGIGAALQGLAFPGLLQGSNSTGYMDIGGVQRQIDVPAIANVRLGTVYDATAKTGTLNLPTAAQVQTGVSFDNGSTGTYDGSDRWTDPGVAAVLLATTYKANSLTNNRTGTLDIGGSVWAAPIASYTDATKFGGFVKKLLSLAQFLGLK